MKFLIAGLGNVGTEYWGTRHNVGFRVVNAVAGEAGVAFAEMRYGAVARLRVKSAELILLKPNTFMNLSGLAVRYWLQKENLEADRLLVVVDDIALPFGALRLKPRGSAAGHNGLRHIEETLGTQNYSRLRFGVGSDFPPGRQINYVLSTFEPGELEQMPARVKQASEMVKSFCLAGVDVTMNLYNHR
ncbi:MAG: aminoacyl-tRNA hydrolase [Tannerella sp.]|jgi:PTH1 family peptidyl-tRNA hydrolase|nr:aminoacyl-tRNA hydrolase [Tannerella sp.]